MSEISRPLRYFTRFTAAYVVFLLFAGAMVTSTDSGLAVPDWPLSYGQLMPPMKGGIFYEHGHRMVAALAGLLTVIQAIWLQVSVERRALRVLGWIAVVAVIAQGLLGGLTVLRLLPTSISVSHALLAEIYFALHLVMAFLCTKSWEEWREGNPVRRSNTLTWWAHFAVVLVFLQILLGAITRHLGAAVAIPDFPLAFGRLVPAFESVGIVAHYSHRVGALVVTILIAAMLPLVRRFGGAVSRRLYLGASLLVLAQIFLGAYTVLSVRHPIVASLHLVGGALLFGTMILLMLASRYEPEIGAPGFFVEAAA